MRNCQKIMHNIRQTYNFLLETIGNQMETTTIQQLQDNSIQIPIHFECEELEKIFIKAYSSNGKFLSQKDALKISEITINSFRRNCWDELVKLKHIHGRSKIKTPFTELKYFRNLKIIGANAFASGLHSIFEFTELELPDSIEEIGSLAFEQSSLEKFQLPKSIQKIGSSIVHFNVEAPEIIIPETTKMPSFGKFAFGKLGSATTIKVPEKYWIRYNNQNLLSKLGISVYALDEYQPEDSTFVPKKVKKGTLGEIEDLRLDLYSLGCYFRALKDEIAPNDIYTKFKLFQKNEPFCQLVPISDPTDWRYTNFQRTSISYRIDNRAQADQIWKDTKNDPEHILQTMKKLLSVIFLHDCQPKLIKSTKNGLIFNLNPKTNTDYMAGLFFVVSYNQNYAHEALTYLNKQLRPKLLNKFAKDYNKKFKKQLLQQFEDMMYLD